MKTVATFFLLIAQVLSLINCQASETLNFQLCQNDGSKNITAPDGFVVFIEQLVIGVTENDSCEEYNPTSHCTVPAEEVQQPPCTLKGKLLLIFLKIFN